MQTFTFPITLSNGPATVTAELDGDRNEITAVTDAYGKPVSVTPYDLDQIEAAIERGGFTIARTYTVTELHALDVMTADTVRFTVEHDEGCVQCIRYRDGIAVPFCSEQFTETAEAFYLDRRFEEEQDAFHDRFAKF
ncbi:MAG: hypothetical protein ACR2GR_00420 [Rhodothermales bacterium]